MTSPWTSRTGFSTRIALQRPRHRLQAGAQDRLDEAQRAAVHDRHLRPVDVDDRVRHPGAGQRRHHVLDGPDRDPGGVAEQRAEPGVGHEVPAGRNQVVAVADVDPAEADAARGRRPEHHAHRPPGMEAHSDERSLALQGGLHVRPQVRKARPGARRPSPAARQCRDLTFLRQIKLYDRLLQSGTDPRKSRCRAAFRTVRTVRPGLPLRSAGHVGSMPQYRPCAGNGGSSGLPSAGHPAGRERVARHQPVRAPASRDAVENVSTSIANRRRIERQTDPSPTIRTTIWPSASRPLWMTTRLIGHRRSGECRTLGSVNITLADLTLPGTPGSTGRRPRPR